MMTMMIVMFVHVLHVWVGHRLSTVNTGAILGSVSGYY